MKFGILQWHSEPTARHSVGDDPFAEDAAQNRSTSAAWKRQGGLLEVFHCCFYKEAIIGRSLRHFFEEKTYKKECKN